MLNADLKQTIVNLKAASYNSLPTVNLLEKYKDSDIREKFNAWKKSTISTEFSNTNGIDKVGDIVNFMGGDNNMIHFTSEILGFDGDGKAFMLWDCYWLPIDLEAKNRKVSDG